MNEIPWLPREFDLGAPNDVVELRELLSGTVIEQAFEEYIKDYLTFFTHDAWRKVSGDCRVFLPVGARATHPFQLGKLFGLTNTLRSLRRFRGFDRLLEGFGNPTQIVATMFEVNAAQWCATRMLTFDIELCPMIVVNGGVKSPEFLWRTFVGDLYVECKRGVDFEQTFAKRLNRR